MADLDFTVGFFIFITGLCIGSFLNVVILRSLSEESIIFPASKCPKCQSKLKWWHNIPLISYILLRGKCAFCGEKISIQYPIIEFLTGYLFLCSFLKYGYSFSTIFVIIFLSMFIVISTTDIREHVAFNLHSYILAAAGLVYNFFNFGNLYDGRIWIFHTSFVYAILGLILGALLIGIYFGLGYLVFKTMIIGPGDIFIAGALGACLGWKYIILVIIGAVIIQVLTFLPVFFKKLVIKKDYLTIFGFLIFTVVALGNYLYLKYINTEIFAVNILVTIALITSGAFLCKRIIDTLPENLADLNEAILSGNQQDEEATNELSHMPFGPALCCAALMFIFLH